MTPELRNKLQTFLFDSTPLWDSEDLELIAKWIDENIVQEQERLKELLKDSVKLIKYWHGQSNYLGGKMPFVIGEIWQEYYDNSPELKGIREAVK